MMTAVVDPSPAVGRFRTAWNAAHAPAPGVPRWAVVVAYGVPFTVLPSAIWRISEIFLHDQEHGRGDVPGWLPMQVYVIALSVLSEVLAFTAVGLVATWGERVPNWVPVLRGRRVPPLAAVVPAALGALVLTTMWTAALVCELRGVTLRGDPMPADFPSQAGGWRAAYFYVAYAPLLLWGPLLAAVTAAYYRRRRAPGAAGR